MSDDGEDDFLQPMDFSVSLAESPQQMEFRAAELREKTARLDLAIGEFDYEQRKREFDKRANQSWLSEFLRGLGF